MTVPAAKARTGTRSAAGRPRRPARRAPGRTAGLLPEAPGCAASRAARGPPGSGAGRRAAASRRAGARCRRTAERRPRARGARAAWRQLVPGRVGVGDHRQAFGREARGHQEGHPAHQDVGLAGPGPASTARWRSTGASMQARCSESRTAAGAGSTFALMAHPGPGQPRPRDRPRVALRRPPGTRRPRTGPGSRGPGNPPRRPG